MKKILCILVLIIANILFAQKPPLPPKPKKQENVSANKNTNSMKMYGEQTKKVLPKFNVLLSESSNSKSVYYYKTIEKKLTELDSTLTAEQIVSFTKFNISENKINPTLLDSLANKAYKLNDVKNYQEAVKTANLILEQSANNITAHKEISLAYKHLGKDELSKKHLGMMAKIISSVFKYSDGSYESPFLINNFFEGLSIYEASFRCKPKKVTLMLDKQNRMLGAYNGYSSYWDEIFIRYSELSHWKPQLKKEDYRVEQ